MLAWFGLRLYPRPLPDAHSHPASQANQGSREPSLCKMNMQMLPIIKTKITAYGEAPQSGYRCPDPHGTVTGGGMPHTVYMLRTWHHSQCPAYTYALQMPQTYTCMQVGRLGTYSN